MIAFACAGCAHRLKVADAAVGKKVRCPHCGRLQPISDSPPIISAAVAKDDEAISPPSPASPSTKPHIAPRHSPPPSPRPDDAPPSAPPARLSVAGYEILGELGRGGMGVVYKARQKKLNRLVALKMIRDADYADAADLARFRTEAEAIARLQHPNIVQIHEIGEHDGRPFFSLEFCPGGSLNRQLAGTPLPPQQAVQLMETLAWAMQAAHEANVIHRDLKPANVLLAADGAPKITDFGLAKKLDDVGQTQSGVVVGTPSYMAPEQARGKVRKLGPASDVYALGAILYELLTGRPPFKAATSLDTLLQVMNDEPVPPSQLQSKTPRDLETICLKCLQKERSKRYTSAADLAKDLRRYRAGEPIQARPVGRVERAGKWVRRHKGLSAGLTAAVLALLLGTGVAIWFAFAANASAGDAERKADAEAKATRAAEKATRAAETARQGESEARRQESARADGEARARKDADRERAEVVRQLDQARRSLFTAQLMRVAGVMEREPSLALELLHDYNACPLDLRDFAWGWYEGRCRRVRHVLPGDKGPIRKVYALAFSGDGKLLASGGLNSLKLWDVASGQEKATLKGTTGPVNCVAFSPDGKLLAAAGGGRLDFKTRKFAGELKLWDLASGLEKVAFKGHTDSVRSVAFSGDGKLLASASSDKTVRLWDVASGQEKALLQEHSNVMSVAFSGDGKLLASGGGESKKPGEIKLWDVADRRVKASLQGHTEFVTSVAFSGDGKLLASGGSDKTIRLWDVASGQEKAVLQGHSKGVMSVAFSGDGKVLASGDFEQTVKVWDVARGQEKTTFRGHWGYGAFSVALTGDGKMLASGGYDNAIKLWDLAGAQEKPILQGDLSSVKAFAFSGDAKLLALCSGDKTIKLCDATTSQQRAVLEGSAGVEGVAITSDGKTLASFSGDTTIKIWDVLSGQVKTTLQGHTVPVWSLNFSGDGKLLASVGKEPFKPGKIATPRKPEEIKVWDVASGQEKASPKGHNGGVNRVALSGDGKLLAAVGIRSGIPTTEVFTLWDLTSGRVKASRKGDIGAQCVAFSSDGKLIASGGGVLYSSAHLKLWDVVSGQEKASLKGHTGVVHSVAFSPDGKLLASGSDGTVELWDVATGQEKGTLQGVAGPVRFLAFSTDAKLLVARADTIKLWKVFSGPEKAALKGHNNWVLAVALSRDGKLLASVSSSGSILGVGQLKLWDMVTGQEKATWDASPGTLAFSPDGKLLASGGPLMLRDLASGRVKATLKGHTKMSSVAFSPDSQLLASAGETYDVKTKQSRGEIKLWNVASGQEKAALQGHVGNVNCVAFSGDGKLLASASGVNDPKAKKFLGEVKLWDVASGQERASLKGHTKMVTSVAFSPDGKLLASASWDRTIKLWDVASGRERATLEDPAEVGRLGFSPDGKTLASASGDYTIKLWDVANARLKASLKGHAGTVTSVAFRADGKLVSGSYDKTIRLWDVAVALEQANAAGR